jgi:4-amino-4-deoxy-L-arabinose transferase-like glycosyltransferase
MTRPTLLFFAIVLASAFVYLIGNGSVSLWDRDEPRYAQTSRQMLQSGDWIVPHFLDKERTAKPALIYWCQASAMKLFGDNAFAARFPSAVAIVLLLVVMWLVLSRAEGAVFALWAVFIFATSGLVIAAAKMCITDAVLLLWVTIGQVCLFNLYRRNASWPVVVIFAVAIGLGGLTKGPVILGMYAATLIVLGILRLIDTYWVPRSLGPNVFDDDSAVDSADASADDRTLSYQRVRHTDPLPPAPIAQPILKTIVAIVIVIAIVAPWVLMVNYRSSGFLFASLKTNVWDRMLHPLEQHSGPPGYYFLTVWLTFFPWSLLLPLAIGLAIHRRADPRTRFALAAIIGPWIMLECVRTKLPHYLLPVFPPLAYLTADALLRCIRGQINDLRSNAFIIPVGIWAVVVTAAASATWIVQYTPLPHAAMTALSIYGAIFGFTVFACFLRRKIATGAIAMGVGTLGFIVILYGWYLPSAQYLRVSPRVAKILIDHQVTHPNQVIMLDYMEPSLAFAQGGTIREAGPVGFSHKFEPLMPEYLVITKSIWDKAPQSLRDDFVVIDSVFGLAYADKGKWVTVMVIRKKTNIEHPTSNVQLPTSNVEVNAEFRSPDHYR